MATMKTLCLTFT